jgi:F0F1-type ATP synthase assembly protein I
VAARSERQRRWLRRAALAIRVSAGVLTLVGAIGSGVVAARSFGKNSPWVWTVALLAGLGIGVLLLGNPAIHRLADRLERMADQHDGRRDRDERVLPDDVDPPSQSSDRSIR